MKWFATGVARLSLLILLFPMLGYAAENEIDRLHHEFIDPPRDFSLMPFWFWNGKMEPAEVQKQVRDMVSQHVYGAFLHGRDGLQTPYLSEDWFKAFGAGLKESKRSGFEFNFVDEYDWPSGEVRNVWKKDNHQSEVLAKNPELRMKTLAYEAKVVDGPRREEITLEPDVQAVVAARWVGEGQIDASSLTAIDIRGRSGSLPWSVPEGRWVIVQFHLKPAMGFDGGFVDLLNPETTKLFSDMVYGEYHRRFGSYFGSTIRYAFADHEGDYGYRIAWTPRLFETFEQRTGYDLRKMLPLLIYDGGDQTVKLRNDYLATITDLYSRSFWQGVTSYAENLGIGRTGHAWEESLQWSAALQGSLFMVERGLNPVGVDSLEDFGRQSLNFKVGQSVADFEGRRFACENQGVQGTNSYLDLEAIRKGTNAIAAWGVNLFIPHAFDYDAGRANYPPDWLHQPYWPFFHYYADYTRRISYMNADSHHDTNVLLYYPIDTMWSDTKPLFSGTTDYGQIGKPVAWKNQTTLINDYYTRIILGLTDHQWDYDIADDQYLNQARVEGNELVIGPQHFRAIVLPPITTLSRATLRKLQEFHQAGGVIFGIKLLPTASPEAGDHDAEIMSGIRALFDAKNQGVTFIHDSVDELIHNLDTQVAKDVEVVSGPSEHLFVQHRTKLNTEYYWVVNDTDHARTNEIHLSAEGTAEKWDALTGKIEPLFSMQMKKGTDVRITMGPWDAFYIVYRRGQNEPQSLRLEATNADSIDGVTEQGNEGSVHLSGVARAPGLFADFSRGDTQFRAEARGDGAQPLVLDGAWQFKPAPARISVPYARVNTAAAQDGSAAGWTSAAFDDSGWQDAWLSDEQTSIRRWELIGPLANPDNNGFGTVYAPEKSFDAQGKYEGTQGKISWHTYDSNEPHLALDDWNIWMKTQGGRDSGIGYIVDLNSGLQTQGQEWVVSYAHTYLYAPTARHAQFVVAADNWAAVWLNGKQVFAQLRTPFWYELNDHWADRMDVDLHQGWNEVLVKVGKGRGASSGFYGFTFRVADQQGRPMTDVVAASDPKSDETKARPVGRQTWYRVEVPPGCVAVLPPHLHGNYQMYYNGQRLAATGDRPVALHNPIEVGRNVLVIAARSNEPLTQPIEFVTGQTPFRLQSWVKTGLANYSGTATYTKTFTLPASFRDKHVMLDLGKVSSVAEVSVNGKPVETLVWSPYSVDITTSLHPGENTLSIAVTNTEANQRAVGTWRHILGNIDECGMEGPVSLIPYIDAVVPLHAMAAGARGVASER